MKRITIFIFGMILMHIIFSLAMAGYMSYLYQDRVPNVRHVDFDRKKAPNLLVSYMIDRGSDDKDKILFTGSSFSWGYPFPKISSYPYLLKNKLSDKNVVNMSVVGDNPLYTRQTLCLLNRHGIKVDKLVVEVNLANFSPVNERFLENDSLKRCENYSDLEFALDGFLPYISFFFSTPVGLNHFDIVHDQFDYPRERDRVFRFNKLREGYFNTPSEAENTFEAKSKVITTMLNAAKEVSNEVIFFIAPINSYGVRLSQYNVESLKKQAEDIVKACKTIEGVICLDTNFDIDKKYFMNITHLNMAGHEFFADYIIDYLK